jgi:hypothetical protein
MEGTSGNKRKYVTMSNIIRNLIDLIDKQQPSIEDKVLLSECPFHGKSVDKAH